MTWKAMAFWITSRMRTKRKRVDDKLMVIKLFASNYARDLICSYNNKYDIFVSKSKFVDTACHQVVVVAITSPLYLNAIFIILLSYSLRLYIPSTISFWIYLTELIVELVCDIYTMESESYSLNSGGWRLSFTYTIVSTVTNYTPISLTRSVFHWHPVRRA